MRYTNRNTQRATKVIPVLCGLLFASFCFTYLYVLQPGYMERLQYILSKGATQYNPTIGAVLITLVLTLVGTLIHNLIRFPARMLAWAWLPSVYLLTWLTSFSLGRISVDTASPHYFLLILLPIIYIIGIWFAHAIPDRGNEHGNFGGYLLPNLLVLFMAFLCLGVVTDTDDTFHRDAKAERIFRSTQPEDVFLMNENEDKTSSLLFSMRSYLLCQKGHMGGELFSYPISMGGSRDLLPEYVDTTDAEDFGRKVYALLGAEPDAIKPKETLRYLEMLAQKDTLNNTALHDYLLSAYLLDRDLSSFSRALSLGKDSTLYELPLHYREALILEAAFAEDSAMFLRDTVIAAKYQQFDSIRCHNILHRDASRKSFGKTYWYYFFYEQ